MDVVVIGTVVMEITAKPIAEQNTWKEKQRIVHLLNYVPELRGKTLLIEEEIPAKEVEVSLRLDGAAVKKVYLAPDRTELRFETADGYVHFTVPEMNGYCMVVTETE